ncbi:4Fe-4S dicluster domain-containing protein [Candidatus Hydrogenedentota bacterium]
MKAGVGTVAATASLAAMLSPLRARERGIGLSEFLQRHYERLTPEMMEKVLTRIESEIATDYGVKANVKDLKAMSKVEFGFALNLSLCNGSRKCVTACVQENNQCRQPGIQYIRVVEMEYGSFNLEHSDHYYDHESVPLKGKYYLPVQCHQCRKAFCVRACPVKATWTEPDGITVIDYNWCIGCRYCMAACPYGARRFNFQKPVIPREEINPDMAYLGNRIRPVGVVEKCTFCLQRTRDGKFPACLEACPTGARVFGNLLDPNSNINYIINNKRVYILKEDAGTIPRFYYCFDK